ncbi:hypothetical protein Tsubulata_049085 [Turnera subulata]|uniref:Uncharacterized protein n=1 Tax=Turnera subulata TaxID=218843 RepID=A0A9Q0F583_9ROSI|nr:hypothetical protein Tsubulata_049085 [Turnera subulata]
MIKSGVFGYNIRVSRNPNPEIEYLSSHPISLLAYALSILIFCRLTIADNNNLVPWKEEENKLPFDDNSSLSISSLKDADIFRTGRYRTIED